MRKILLVWATSFLAVTGSVSGTLKDPSGASVPGAVLTITNIAMGIQNTTTSDAKGLYSFPSLPVGRYDLKIEAEGFTSQTRSGVAVDANSALRLDATLALAEKREEMTVFESDTRVETVSTQMGEVVSGTKMTAVALNGRSYTDLLALQPGVIPVTTIQPNSIVMAGVTGAIAPSGQLNPGNLSIGGSRESANGFMVNGSDVQEHMNGGTSIIPNLDSIAEFRVLTNNFDAEYGNYNGGLVNVVTKSGGNQLHGDAFEFLRNTLLDARNFFSPERAFFRQNQFGGVVGGPIQRQKVFLFGDYQGTRTNQGLDTGLISVPSLEDRTGNLADAAGSLKGTVNGNYWANQLSQKLGYGISPGEPYYTAGCTGPTQCVFPNAVVPQRAWSAPAQHLLQYIPAPSNGTNLFSTSGSGQTVRDDKGAVRIDGNSRLGLLSAYYFFDDYSLNNPYPTGQGGANVPGFNALTFGRAQLVNLGYTRTFSGTLVNEMHLSFMRNANTVGDPQGGVGVSLASQGFVTGPGTPGIVPLAAKIEGVENVVFNSYTIGETITGLRQANNIFQVIDHVSKVLGAHMITMGGQIHYDQINVNPDSTFNGTFSFFGTETGSDFADFLLGIPSSYTQGDSQSYYGRNHYAGLFAQGSWRARPNLTVTYGLRWDLLPPWSEKYNQVQTLKLGAQSAVYPGAPNGLVFPGDPGIPSTLAPARYNDFSPRVGLAYAPGAGKTSIRAGYGRFFTAIEGITLGIMDAVLPYGSSYTSPGPPLFATPFITAASGHNDGQRFPLTFPSLKASAKNPETDINFSQYEPVNGMPSYNPGNVTPYSENYFLSIDRQLGKDTLASVSYVGAQAHHLLVLVSANPGNPALCLSLSQPGAVAPGSPTCGPFAENSGFTTSSGQLIQGTRGPFNSAFGSVDYQSTMGNSNYNALEVTVRHNTPRLEFVAGYTYGKSMDQSSSIAEQVNPFDFRATYAPSAFDLKHNFVASYRYEIPFTRGWILSGITRFSSGFPVTLVNNTDRSLIGSQPNGVNNFGVDEPDVAPGQLDLNRDPRNGKAAFDTALFSLQPLGSPGNAARRIFYGPGISNFDVALLKNIRLPESKSLQIRIEAFNVFNHAQFYGAGTVDGNISSPTFGHIIQAAAPRLLQAAIKFYF